MATGKGSNNALSVWLSCSIRGRVIRSPNIYYPRLAFYSIGYVSFELCAGLNRFFFISVKGFMDGEIAFC